MTNSQRLVEAKEMRKNTVAAIDGLTKRGAKSWTIGGQQYTAMDVSELLKLLQYWENQIMALSGGQRIIRRVVPVND